MDISTLDGFFTSLTIGPIVLEVEDWLPTALGIERNEIEIWKSNKKLRKYLELLLRFFESISTNLLLKHEKFKPLLYKDDQGKPVYQYWCRGFIIGTFFAEDLWKKLTNDLNFGTLLIPFVAFGAETSKELWRDVRINSIPLEEWEEIIIANVYKIQKYWLQYDEFDDQNSDEDEYFDDDYVYSEKNSGLFEQNDDFLSKIIRNNKIGRNDPCPCGSGIKFKHCCMK